MGIKDRLEQEARDLIEAIKPMFSDFCGGYLDDDVDVQVYKKNCFWHECIKLSEGNHLCCLEIKRFYYVKSKDDSLSIIVRWFDWDDELVYNSNYFAQMSNEAVIERTKLMLDTAMQSANLTHRIHQDRKRAK